MCLPGVIFESQFGKVVCQSDVTNAQRASLTGAIFSSFNRVLLVVYKHVQGAYSEVTETTQVIPVLQFY